MGEQRPFRLMPDQASQFAGEMDALFFLLSFLTIAFTLLVAALVLFFVIRYRRGNRVDRSNPVHHHNLLELTWSVGPLFLGLAVFVWGAKLFADMRRPPKDAMEIFLIGKRWMWHAQHQNGIRENNEVHLPVGKPVKFTMISQDVIHDFFVPDFRIHQDVIPGIYTQEWCVPTKVGRYRFFCSQYCGTDHSKMVGWVTVMPEAEFQRWLASGGESTGTGAATTVKTMEQMGKELYDQQGCGNCHDSPGIGRGPSLVGLYGSRVRTRDGKLVMADDRYLRESLVNPKEDIAEGYLQVMPSYKSLTEEQILQLIAYMRTLGRQPVIPAASATGAAANTTNTANRSRGATGATNTTATPPGPAGGTQNPTQSNTNTAAPNGPPGPPTRATGGQPSSAGTAR